MKEIIKELEKYGIKIPKQIRRKEGLIQYLMARVSTLRVQEAQLEEKLYNVRAKIILIEEAINKLESGKR